MVNDGKIIKNVDESENFNSLFEVALTLFTFFITFPSINNSAFMKA